MYNSIVFYPFTDLSSSILHYKSGLDGAGQGLERCNPGNGANGIPPSGLPVSVSESLHSDSQSTQCTLQETKLSHKPPGVVSGLDLGAQASAAVLGGLFMTPGSEGEQDVSVHEVEFDPNELEQFNDEFSDFGDTMTEDPDGLQQVAPQVSLFSQAHPPELEFSVLENNSDPGFDTIDVDFERPEAAGQNSPVDLGLGQQGDGQESGTVNLIHLAALIFCRMTIFGGDKCWRFLPICQQHKTKTHLNGILYILFLCFLFQRLQHSNKTLESWTRYICVTTQLLMWTPAPITRLVTDTRATAWMNRISVVSMTFPDYFSDLLLFCYCPGNLDQFSYVFLSLVVSVNSVMSTRVLSNLSVQRSVGCTGFFPLGNAPEADLPAASIRFQGHDLEEMLTSHHGRYIDAAHDPDVTDEVCSCSLLGKRFWCDKYKK